MLKGGGSEWVLEERMDARGTNKSPDASQWPLESRGWQEYWWGGGHKWEVEGKGQRIRIRWVRLCRALYSSFSPFFFCLRIYIKWYWVFGFLFIEEHSHVAGNRLQKAGFWTSHHTRARATLWTQLQWKNGILNLAEGHLLVQCLFKSLTIIRTQWGQRQKRKEEKKNR